MTPQELIDACGDKLVITLVLPHRSCRGEQVRLCGRSGPFGDMLCDNGSGLVVRFKAADVLKWARKQLFMTNGFNH